MRNTRRTFLKRMLATSGAVALGSTALPLTVMADWPQAAFQAKTVEEAITALFNSPNVQKTDQIEIIEIKAPKLAQSGAEVPLEVTVNLSQLESIAIIVEENSVPLVAQLNLTDDAMGWVKMRIKMAKTSDVVIVAKAQDQLYVARQKVEVVEGGCT